MIHTVWMWKWAVKTQKGFMIGILNINGGVHFDPEPSILLRVTSILEQKCVVDNFKMLVALTNTNIQKMSSRSIFCHQHPKIVVNFLGLTLISLLQVRQMCHFHVTIFIVQSLESWITKITWKWFFGNLLIFFNFISHIPQGQARQFRLSNII